MKASASQASPRRRLLTLLAVLSILALLVPMATLGHHRPGHRGGPPAHPPGLLINIQLLAINDYHGHLEPNTPGNVGGVPAGGAEYLATHLELLRQGKKHSLTVAAGDLIGGTPFLSGLFHDEPSVESLNAMKLDVSSVGNHEFDHGVDELLRHQHGGCHPVSGCFFPDEPYEGADFPWLAANVTSASTGETVLPPYWIKQFENVKVGFIGMTLEGTPTLVAQSGIQGWNFADEAETANALVPELQAQGVEAIVVLLHEGGIPTSISDIDGCVGISGPIVEIHNNLDPAIDVLITGHTHLPYNCVLTDPDGSPRRVTSAFAFGRVISEVNLVINRRTGEVRRDLVTATNHVVHQSVDPHPDLTAVLDKWRPLAQELGNQPVGQITADITRAGGPADDRSRESDLGNMIADAQLWATTVNGAQIAFMNPGGMRADLLFASSPAGEGDGVVTYGEAFNVQPFGNLLTTIPMTGAQVVAVLEEQCQPAGSSRPFLHLGVSVGFSYDLDRTITGGNCTSVSISNVQLNGTALDPSATYRVTVNNFLVDGGDNFGTFAEVPVSQRVGAGIDLNALIAYLGEEGPIAPPGTDRVNEAF
ncbi:MAG TPA: bifunctional metallophosphatase/5'-nucleotidase [Candidatus Limnocylindria bacterium]|nr:bifunctional metallophosphatase/5'-nucleotidase [Candidatus Limnocylindria bacterium]